MTESEALSLDEIVARNVRFLRKDRDLSVRELAAKLGVSRSQVYDMERPRPGREQREVKWSELVALIDALGVTLFELVLPPEGVALARGEVILGILRSDATIEDELDADYVGEPLEGHDVSLALFGISEFATDPDVVAKFAANMREEKETRMAIMQEAMEVVLQRMDEEWEKRNESASKG